MNPVFQLVFVFLYVYYLRDYRNFRKKRLLQKVWFICLNALTLGLFTATILNFRPPMPTMFFSQFLGPRVHQILEEAAHFEADY